MTRNPHDALFKAVLQHPKNAAAELEHILDSNLAAAVEWSTLALEPGSYIDPRLADRHSDLLFSARAHASGQPLLAYLLLEHQSSDDPTMCLRLLESGWKSGTRFSDLFSTDVGPLVSAIPDFSYAVDNLAHTDDRDLRRRALANHARLAL